MNGGFSSVSIFLSVQVQCCGFCPASSRCATLRERSALRFFFFSMKALYHQCESWAWGGADLKGPVWLWEASLYFDTWRCSIWAYFSVDCGKGLKFKESRPFSVQLRALTMEMQRWITRWKTKRWLWDSTLTAVVTLMLIIQAAGVRAGKILHDVTHLTVTLPTARYFG